VFEKGDLVDIVNPHLYSLKDDQSLAVIISEKHITIAKIKVFLVQICNEKTPLIRDILPQNLRMHNSTKATSGTKWWM